MTSQYTPRIAKPEPTRHGPVETTEAKFSPVIAVLMVMSWVTMGVFFNTMHPNQIKDVLFPFSYLPAVGVIMATSFLTFGYLRKSSVLGIVAGVTFGILFWLMVRGMLNRPAFLYVVVPWIALELVLTITRER